MLASDWLLCFSSICKFRRFNNLLATISHLFELYFKFRRFALFVQTKKVISMNYGSSASSWKQWRWVRLDLILTLTNIHTISNLNLRSSTEFKDILTWNISQMITKTVLFWTESQWKLRQQHDQDFSMEGKPFQNKY